MTAEEYLTALEKQAQFLRDASLPPLQRHFAEDAFWREIEKKAAPVMARALHEELSEHYGIALEEVQKICESPESYWKNRLSDFYDMLTTKLQSRGLPTPPKPLFGALPTGSLNAMTLAVPESEDRLIVFHDGVFTFINLFIKVMLLCFEAESEKDVAEKYRKFSEAVRRLDNLLAAYIFGGHPQKAEPWLLSSEFASLHENLLNTCETFILAHELGHVSNKHEPVDESCIDRKHLADLDLEVVVRGWVQERQADAWAAAATLMVYPLPHIGGTNPMTYAGIEAYFLGSELIERALSIVRTGSEETDVPLTHPSPRERRVKLRQDLLDHTDLLKGNPMIRIVDPKEPNANPVLRVANKFVHYCTSMWVVLRPVFIERHQAHAKPAHLWDALT